ncbi:hypothetical protein [Prauserella cavernicola]|uniref:Tape measure protein n=1 Tax=Prauserella cavernicola TaxID=2800127 RepID=A0A934QTK3_9PSEU|nr:hypothetical protein [Prauserella cavernicola]MBK1785138.1 hypothetical protein [Prauserella cavernicola]
MADSQRTIRIRFDGTADRLRAAANRVREELRASTRGVTDYNKHIADAAARVRRAYDGEADATEKLRVAQARLQEVRDAAVVKASTLAAAEAAVAKATRGVAAAQATHAEATRQYGEAQQEAVRQAEEARRSSGRLRAAITWVGDAADRARGMVTRFGGAFLRLALVGAALNGVIGLVAGLAGVIASASGALGLLPGIAAAAVAGLVAVKLGGEGIERAFKRLTPTLDGLRSAVSGTFERGLRPAVDNLNEALPKTETGLNAVAASVSDAATGFTAMLKQGRNTTTLNRILLTSSRTVRNLGKFLAPVGQALLDIADVGGEVFADLTEGAGAAGERFAEFIKQAKESGQLREWMQEGIDTFREIGDVLGDVWATVRSVFAALEEGGAGLGGVLGPAIETLKEFVESAEGQEVFRTLGGILEDCSRIITSLLEPALALLQPIIGPLGRAVDTLANFVEEDLAPALETLAEFIGPLIGLALDLTTAADGLGIKVLVAAAALATFASAARRLKGIGSTIAGAFSWRNSRADGRRDGNGYVGGVVESTEKGGKKKGPSAARQFGGAFSQGLKALGWVGLGYAIADEITGGWLSARVEDTVAWTGEQMTNLIVNEWGPKITSASKGLTDFGNTATQTWTTVANTTTQKAGEITATIGQKAGEIPTFWNTAMSTTASGNTLAWTGIADQVRGKAFWAASSATTAATNTRNGWWSQLSATGSGNATIWDRISRDAGNKSRSAALSAKTQANNARAWWAGGVNGAAGANNNAWARIVAETRRQGDINRKRAENAASGVRNAFSGMSLWSQGSAIMSSLRVGMQAALPGVLGFAAGIASQIAAVKGPIEKDRRLLIPQGRAIMQSLTTGLDSGLTEVLRTAAAIAPAIAARVGGSGVVTRGYLDAAALPVTGQTATAGSSSTSTPTEQITEVRVFIGDRELTDIVRTEVTTRDRDTRRRASQGVGAAR